VIKDICKPFLFVRSACCVIAGSRGVVKATPLSFKVIYKVF